jgi:hypothetical protein
VPEGLTLLVIGPGPAGPADRGDSQSGAHDCPASLAGYRHAIDDLSQRIEALTARRATLISHLHQAAYRHSSVSPASEEKNPDGLPERARRPARPPR